VGLLDVRLRRVRRRRRPTALTDIAGGGALA